MGPRLGGRGDSADADTYVTQDAVLQWGRGSVAAETDPRGGQQDA